MGALFYVLPRLERIAKDKNIRVRTVKRSASASPATGSSKAHELEQKTLLTWPLPQPQIPDLRDIYGQAQFLITYISFL